jgi:hypothetical protein
MMTKHRAFCGAVAALVLAIGSHAWADDLGDASDDVTIEDPAKTTSDARADDLGEASDDVTIEDPTKAAHEAMAKRYARIQKEKKESLIDGNAFASSEKHLFLNTSMIDNPAVGALHLTPALASRPCILLPRSTSSSVA